MGLSLLRRTIAPSELDLRSKRFVMAMATADLRRSGGERAKLSEARRGGLGGSPWRIAEELTV